MEHFFKVDLDEIEEKMTKEQKEELKFAKEFNKIKPTALDIAVKHQFKSHVQFLLSKKEPMTLKALVYALENKDIELIDLLIQNDAPLNTCTFDYAIMYGNENIISVILNYCKKKQVKMGTSVIGLLIIRLNGLSEDLNDTLFYEEEKKEFMKMLEFLIENNAVLLDEMFTLTKDKDILKMLFDYKKKLIQNKTGEFEEIKKN